MSHIVFSHGNSFPARTYRVLLDMMRQGLALDPEVLEPAEQDALRGRSLFLFALRIWLEPHPHLLYPQFKQVAHPSIRTSALVEHL